MVVASAYKESNECLQYKVGEDAWLGSTANMFKDLKFSLHRNAQDQPPQMSLTMTFMYMKGDREDESKLQVHPINKSSPVRANLLRQPDPDTMGGPTVPTPLSCHTLSCFGI